MGGLEFLDKPRSLMSGRRGAVLAPLMRGQITPSGGNIDIQQGVPIETVRYALLFNDHLEVPKVTGGALAIDSLNVFLPGVLHEHRVRPMPGGCDLSAISFAIWHRQEKAEPGLWTIWHESAVQPIPLDQQAPDLALRLRLQNALIVPHRDVPLDEVQNFKEARRDELRALNFHLEQIAITVAQNGGDPRAARHEFERFELELENYLKVAKAANWRKSLLGLDVKFDLGEAVKSAWTSFPAAGVITYGLGSAILAGLSIAGSAVAGGIKIEKAVGTSAIGGGVKPFSYVAHIANDL